MKKFLITLVLALITGCTQHSFIQTEKYIVRSEMTDIRNTPIHTKSGLGSVKIGEQISYVDDVDNFIISYPADYPKEKPIFMNDMSMNRSIESCSPSITGASKTSSLNEAEGEWGKVDFWDDSEAVYKLYIQADDPSIPQTIPLCSPPFPHDILDRQYVECTGDEKINCQNVQRQYEIDHGLYSAYAFCSQKNGKTVLICISQMTDNPGLAEEIFRTFRWVD